MDIHYQSLPYRLNEQEHGYSENVHLISDPALNSYLAKLCDKNMIQPLINQHVNYLYQGLVRVLLNAVFPRKHCYIETRMIHEHPKEAIYEGQVIDPDTKVVVVDLARAGVLPSMVCFDTFNTLLNPKTVRQDHIFINRKINDKQKVIGTEISGFKIGGLIDDAIMVIPDPMGATGSSMEDTVNVYMNGSYGKPKRIIALHLIITPEYIKRVTTSIPMLEIFALRLDRGLSSPEVLKTIPGTHIDLEKGLNHNQYIVPGAGGVGEIINNSFV